MSREHGLATPSPTGTRPSRGTPRILLCDAVGALGSCGPQVGPPTGGPGAGVVDVSGTSDLVSDGV
eukprot:8050863-Pyramimonas_sp.AAC.1